MPELAVVTGLGPTGIPNTGGFNELTVLIGDKEAVAIVPGLCELSQYEVVEVNCGLNELYHPPVNEITAINSLTCKGCKVRGLCDPYMNQTAGRN